MTPLQSSSRIRIIDLTGNSEDDGAFMSPPTRQQPSRRGKRTRQVANHSPKSTTPTQLDLRQKRTKNQQRLVTDIFNDNDTDDEHENDSDSEEEDHKADSDVKLMAPPSNFQPVMQPIISKKNVRKSSSKRRKSKNRGGDDDDDDEDDIQIVGTKNSFQLPHLRQHCTEYPISDDPTQFCKDCYCYVCDAKASECPLWKKSHCNAKDRGNSAHYWRQKRSDWKMHGNCIANRTRSYGSTPESSQSETSTSSNICIGACAFGEKGRLAPVMIATLFASNNVHLEMRTNSNNVHVQMRTNNGNELFRDTKTASVGSPSRSPGLTSFQKTHHPAAQERCVHATFAQAVNTNRSPGWLSPNRTLKTRSQSATAQHLRKKIRS